ncbi:MAG: T9SS type A sorting domain-containing protein [Bacteroidales bacterium]|jgi:hypothetical protein|nr:T9SS type A sorting domain-containing protein [Bacteroidales bacterium]
MKTQLLFAALFFSALGTFSQEWMYTDLTEPKLRMASAALGSKAYFAGGDNNDEDLSLVEIYDVTDESWSYAELSLARSFMVGISCGSKVLFAGGTNLIDTCYTRVDIYDTLTQEWTTAELSAPRFLLSTVAYGNKVLFAGGLDLATMDPSNAVDIYDVETGEWDTAYLSEARFAMGETVVGDVAVFAGGDNFNTFSGQVDLYNFTTNAWSTMTMVLPRGYNAACAAGGKLMIVGGMTNRYNSNSATNLIEIYDFGDETWDYSEFPNPRAFIEPAVALGDQVYFVAGGNFAASGGGWASSVNIVDIYTIQTGEWTEDFLTHDLMNHTVTTLETPQASYLFVAGGASKQLDESYSTVEIMWSPVGIPEVQSSEFKVQSYPNPFHSSIEFRVSSIESQSVSLKIYNAHGQLVATVLDEPLPPGEHTITWNAENLLAGIYYYQLSILQASPSGHAANRQLSSEKLVKY